MHINENHIILAYLKTSIIIPVVTEEGQDYSGFTQMDNGLSRARKEALAIKG